MNWLDRLLSAFTETHRQDPKTLLRMAEEAREQVRCSNEQAHELERITAHIAGRFE